MEPALFWLLVVLFTVIGVPSYYGYRAYENKVLIPRNRRKALSQLAYNVAYHNMQHQVGYQPKAIETKPQGFLESTGIMEYFKTRAEKLPDKISLVDILQENHPANTPDTISNFFGLKSKSIYHQGPYAHELLDEEWRYIEQEYKNHARNFIDQHLVNNKRKDNVEKFEENLQKELEMKLDIHRKLQ